ncbi:hypothetical protein ACSL103130_10620 [Actinomyces slackii]
MQGGRDLVDGVRVPALHHGVLVDVAHERDLVLDALGQGAVGAQDEGVGLDPDAAQGGHGVLGGLGLELPGRRQVRDEGDVDEGHVVAPQVGAHLARGLQEGLGLDVAHGAADLGDDDIGDPAVVVGLGLRAHDPLDLIGDVRDDLDRLPQVLPAPLLGDDGGVDLAGGGIGLAGEIDIEEALVVADVEVGLGPVLGDEDLPVLEGVHGAGIDIDVGIELLHDHAQPSGAQEAPNAGGGQALAQRGDHSPGDEDVTGDGGLVPVASSGCVVHGTST